MIASFRMLVYSCFKGEPRRIANKYTAELYFRWHVLMGKCCADPPQRWPWCSERTHKPENFPFKYRETVDTSLLKGRDIIQLTGRVIWESGSPLKKKYSTLIKQTNAISLSIRPAKPVSFFSDVRLVCGFLLPSHVPDKWKYSACAKAKVVHEIPTFPVAKAVEVTNISILIIMDGLWLRLIDWISVFKCCGRKRKLCCSLPIITMRARWQI